MRLLLIKERLFLFGEFALSKSQYLYHKELFLRIFLTQFNFSLSQLLLEKEEATNPIMKDPYYSIQRAN